MPRVAPDLFDQLVWPLTETSGPYRNIGQFSPNSPTTDLTVNNTITRTGTGIFDVNCPLMPGTSNIPSGSSATRNSIIGANSVTFAPPITVSCWVMIRSYTTGQNMTVFAKEYRDPSISGNTWATPFNCFMIGTGTANGGGDWF